MVAVQLIVALVLAASMKFLWGMLNTMQLITQFPLLQVNFPALSKDFYAGLVDITTL